MRKIVLTLCAACFVLGGCADSGSVMSTTAAPATTTYAAVEETETEVASIQAEEASTSQEETKIQEGEIESNKSQNSDASGIIMLIHNNIKFTIISINPDSGKEKTIATFRLDDYTKRWKSDVITYSWMQNSSYSNLRDRFSPDFSKMVATKYFTETNMGHAGWVDTSGKFFDVTEALGEAAKSDFEIPQSYCGYGFTDNGLFAYGVEEYNNDGIPRISHYRYAPLDNLIPGTSWELESYDDYIYPREQFTSGPKPLFDSDCMRPTDWIDDSHVIIDNLSLRNNKPESYSVIWDTKNRSETEYIPGGNSRYNWSGVVSPNGSMVAFLSRPATENGVTKLYKTSLTGSDPIEIHLADVEKIQSTMSNPIICTLLDWK